jgi:NitT/TauT family transport system ATP-binding protein
MPLNCISVKDLRKSYPIDGHSDLQTLDISNLKLSSSELTCIVGPTGCGKTTLLNILSGVDVKYEGNIDCIPSGAPKTAYMFQQDLLLPWRTVAQNITIGLEASGVEVQSEATEEWLQRLRLTDFARAYPSALSVGMRQRVALARTLALNADLYLFDEPLSAQDFPSRIAIEEILRALVRRNDCITVVVTHNIEEAIVLGDRIIVLSGRPARFVDDITISDMPGTNRSVAGRKDPIMAHYFHKVVEALTIAETSNG